MIQVWEIDSKNYYTGKSYFVEKVQDNHVTEPLLVGYIKPYWTGLQWTEGATQEEIEEFNKSNKIDICHDVIKTNKELMEENEQLKINNLEMSDLILDLSMQVMELLTK